MKVSRKGQKEMVAEMNIYKIAKLHKKYSEISEQASKEDNHIIADASTVVCTHLRNAQKELDKLLENLKD